MEIPGVIQRLFFSKKEKKMFKILIFFWKGHAGHFSYLKLVNIIGNLAMVVDTSVKLVINVKLY